MPKIDLLELIFPKSCLGCGKNGQYICNSCIEKEVVNRQVCPKCGKAAIDGMVHTKCQTKLGLNAQIGLWNYSGVVRKAILALKYKFARDITKELFERAIERIEKGRFVFPKNCILVPVPLFWYRENVRGFNQAEEVGRLIAKKMGWKFTPDLIIRTASAVPQAGLKRKDRLTNLRGAFALNPRYQIRDTEYTFILFDDVWTTGSTIKEAGKVIKRKGALNVWGITLAVTGHSFGKPIGTSV